MQEAILIRRVEETFIDLFRQGMVNGTVHTCIGQEFSALAFCKQLKKDDFVFSNHRCHGHYISYTGDYTGLLAEVTGKQSGTCGGIGGSQHLCKGNFYSNGIQGGIMPVAAGMALANKLKGNKNIGVVFIGDGTLGEGVVYEAFNMISKWEIPILIVLDNNYYAQSTHQSLNLSGDIMKRPQSFGITTFEGSTDNYMDLYNKAGESIDYVRKEKKPAFHLVHTYRLAAHSTGDDFRDPAEVQYYLENDPINAFSKNSPELYSEIVCKAEKQIQQAIDQAKGDSEQKLQEYFKEDDFFSVPNQIQWNEITISTSTERLIDKINKTFDVLMEQNNDIIFIGEDIKSPYGGAFKATRGLSTKYPERVFTTPISEAGITGIANGLALKGYRPFLEIMFGDFITLTFDQIINHASKFYHMYNKQVNCPVVIRTPMGGKRGFGPTHSQTLNKFLIGIDNTKVIAINNLINPFDIYEAIYKHEEHPVIVIENKIDYSRKFSFVPEDIFQHYVIEISDTRYPMLRFLPAASKPDVTVITFGGTIYDVFKAAEILFYERELLTEIIVLTQIYPLDYFVKQFEPHTEFLFVAEEGTKHAGFGSEMIASLVEHNHQMKQAKRIASLPVSIPSSKKLENNVLVNANRIFSTIESVFDGNI